MKKTEQTTSRDTCENGNGHSFLPLYVTNFFGTLNDNFLKTLAGFTVIGWIADEGLKSIAMGVTAGALVLPYILCSPLADRLTAVWAKRRIVRIAKWAELPIMAVAIAGFMLKSPWLVVGSVLLMGLQSSLYSPAKYALIRDIGGEGRISTGMGGMEGVSFLGVLAGTVAGAVIADLEVRHPEWNLSYFCFAAFAALGLAASYTIRAKEELNRALHAINPMRYIRRAYRMAGRYDGLNAVILTLSVFWWGAAMLQMGLLVYGKAENGLNLSATETGALLCAAAIGIVAGQIIAGFVDKRRFLLGATLLTGWIAAVLLLVLYFVPMPPVVFGIVLGLLAFDLGFFKLPLDAEIQKVVKGPKLNTMLAYFNQVSFLFMLAASGCYALVSWAFGPKAFLLLFAVVMLVVPFLFVFSYRSVLLCTGRWIFARRYKVEVEGLEQLEGLDQLEGLGQLERLGLLEKRRVPLLVLPNHPAMVDPMLVSLMFWKTPLKPLSDESFFHTGIVAPAVLRTLGAVPVPDLRKHRTAKGASIARGLGDIVKSTLEDGGNVIFYPSGHIQTEPEHEDIGTRQLAYNICKDLGEAGHRARIIGVRTRGLWGSIWSRAGRTTSPAFVPTFIKSVLLWFFWSPFVRRRRVTMHVEDLTDRVKEWAQGTRLEFNAKLNEWYNQ
ncbi:MAG: MFS transporter [Kiritimatiellae bacterium]|nr:MFS transporter [Kiritimatiellia bacterium]